MSIKKSDLWHPWEHENGRLRKSYPADLVSQVPISSTEENNRGFLLTLALIFNDIKGIIIIRDSMNAMYGVKYGHSKPSGNIGEQHGIILQLQKIFLATLHEVIIFIHDSRDAYESDYIQSILKETPNKTRLVWEMLNKVAHSMHIDDDRFKEFGELPEFLVKARNNVGFHYQTRRQFINGYRKFFFNGISTVLPESREWAYRSTDKNKFDATRYYYADAALQGYYINLFGDEKLAKERMDKSFELISLVIYAINDLLIEYHKTLPNR
jgi:hypothetical protein